MIAFRCINSLPIMCLLSMKDTLSYVVIKKKCQRNISPGDILSLEITLINTVAINDFLLTLDAPTVYFYLR